MANLKYVNPKHQDATIHETFKQILQGDLNKQKPIAVFERYGVTQADLKTIASLIKQNSGLDVSKDALDGKLNISEVNTAKNSVEIQEYGLKEILRRQRYDEKNGLKINGAEFDYRSIWSIYEGWMLGKLQHVIAFYMKDLDSIYFVDENFEKTLNNIVEMRKADPQNKVEGRQGEELRSSLGRKLALQLIAHEATHKIIYENGDFKEEEFRLSADLFMLRLTVECSSGKEKEVAEKRHTEVAKDLVALIACDEAIAYLLENKVMSSMGLERVLPMDKETMVKVQAGIDFLVKVERLIEGSNPTPFVVENIPSFEDMTNPKEYVRRVNRLKEYVKRTVPNGLNGAT